MVCVPVSVKMTLLSLVKWTFSVAKKEKKLFEREKDGAIRLAKSARRLTWATLLVVDLTPMTKKYYSWLADISLYAEPEALVTIQPHANKEGMVKYLLAIWSGVRSTTSLTSWLVSLVMRFCRGLWGSNPSACRGDSMPIKIEKTLNMRELLKAPSSLCTQRLCKSHSPCIAVCRICASMTILTPIRSTSIRRRTD